MRLEIFTFGYFMWLFIAVVLFITVYYLLRNNSDKTKYTILFSLTIFMWINHFSRYWLDSDYQTYKIIFVDFCGFNTLLFPFLMLSKKKIAKDFMFYLGALFALHSLLYPNNIEGDLIFQYNTIRFFLAHFLLVSIPLWMIMWKMHTPNIKNIHWVMVYMLVGAIYNLAISSIMYEMHLVGSLINYMGLWGNDVSIYNYAEIIAPFLRYDVVVDGGIVSKPIPFIYMIPTMILFYGPIWVLMSVPFLKRKKVKI